VNISYNKKERAFRVEARTFLKEKLPSELSEKVNSGAELAKKDVTVVLSGDGGDENLAGYRRYRWHLIEEQTRAFLPSAIRRPLFGTLGTVYPKLDWMPKVFRAKSTFESLARNPIEGWLHTVSHYSDKQRQQLFSSQMHRELQGYNAVNVLQGYADQAPTDHPQSLVQYLDLKTYLVGDILTKVDRASMAHALEVRVPLLDHKLVEWMSGLPPELKLKNAEGKYIFKKALETQLPKDILYRKKMGFSVPLANWFRGPLKQKVIDSLLSDDLLDNGYFNPAFIQKLVKQHFSGQRDNSATIWSLLMYASFQRQN
jgi:asparagine synthase (glutamine-hydrolysing)